MQWSVIIDSIPALVDLGVYIVFYGIGTPSLRLTITREKYNETALALLEPYVSLAPTLQQIPFGAKAMQLVFRECPLREHGLYWLNVSVDDSPSICLPFFVEERESWRKQELERKAAAGLSPK